VENDCASCRDNGVDDDVDDDELVLSVQPCYRQRVAFDVLCLSEEPGNKYRTVQNVSGSVTIRQLMPNGRARRSTQEINQFICDKGS